MESWSRTIRFLLLCGLSAAALSCMAEEDDAISTEESVESASEEIVAGKMGVVVAGNDTVASGWVVYVRRGDDEKTPAVFQGPEGLADVFTDGTFEMSADSLSARVRELNPGERIVQGG